MCEEDWNHCRIVQSSLAGERAVDERTFSSLAILSERLQRLKKLDRVFSAIEFSPAVQRLKQQRNTIAVS